MAGSHIDASLIAQLDELRAQVAEYLESSDSRRLIRLAQRLDRLALQAAGGTLDETALTGALGEVAEELDALAEEDERESTSTLILETLPSSARDRLASRNQARLVDHLLSSANIEDAVYDGVEAALLSFAEQAEAADSNTPRPAELQQRLSSVVDKRREQLTEPTSGQPEAIGAEDLRSDNLVSSDPEVASLAEILAERDLTQSRALRNALMTGELVLATDRDRAEVKELGSSELDEEGLQDTTAPGSDDDAMVAEAAADEALLAEATARLSGLRQRMAESRQVAEAERQKAQALATHVADLRQQAAQSATAVASWHLQQQDRARLDELVERTRETARKISRNQIEQLSATAVAFSRLAPDAASDMETHTEALASLVGSGDVQAISQASSALLSVMRAADVGNNGEALLAQAEEHALAAARAAASANYSPDVSEPEAVGGQPGIVETDLLERQLSRFREASWSSALDQERVLASETLLGREESRAQPDLPPVRLESSSRSSAQLETLDFTAVQAATRRRLRELKGLSGLHTASSVDLVSDDAGLEGTAAAQRAVQRRIDPAALAADIIARASTDFTRRSATRRARQLRRSAGDAGATNSGRRDLGLPTRDAWEMQPNVAPLFKRKIGVDRSGDVGRVYLPALYKLTGIDDRPLRKSSWVGGNDPLSSGRVLAKADEAGDGIDLAGQNLDLIKIVEKYFGNAGPRGEQLAEYGEDPTQGEDFQKYVGNEQFRIASAVSEWVASRNQKLSEMASAKPVDEFSTGQLDPETLVGNLKSEAKQIPTTVQEKLRPFMDGANLSDVRFYSGPVAGMAAAAMGAHAFTLKKHVFFADQKLDFESPEGLALFAHELLHTTHFDSAGSVEEKEREAEDMERRIRQAFGSGSTDRSFALEDRGAPNSGGQAMTAGARNANDFAVTEPVPPNKGGFRNMYDPELLVESVAEICLEKMGQEAKKFKARWGSDN